MTENMYGILRNNVKTEQVKVVYKHLLLFLIVVNEYVVRIYQYQCLKNK